MTETGVGTSKGGCPAWVKLLLAGSLMLNVLVIGVIAGHQMQDKDAPKSGNRQVDWILRLVPEDRRDFTKAHFAEIREPLRSLRTERRQHLTQIVAAIRTEPFTPDPLTKVLTARRDAGAQTRTLVHERLVILMTEFTPEERAYFADGLEERITLLQRRKPAN